MNYKLKTIKNEKGLEVLFKKKMGEEVAFLAMNEKGQIGEVSKAWVLKNQANIVNLGVSVEGHLYATKADRLLCDACGKKHNISAMFPIYHVVDKNNEEVIKSSRMICKECLEINDGNDYVQCEDCKRVFDNALICSYEPEMLYRPFKIFQAAPNRLGNITYLCSDCNGKKYVVCAGCECENFGQCIIKTSDMSKRAGFECHKSCVDMIREHRNLERNE